MYILAIDQDAGVPLTALNTDGGITSNTFIMQFLANLLGISVSKIAMSDVSALGAAYLAGLQTGIYKDLDTLKNLNAHKIIYTPQSNQEVILQYYTIWQKVLNTINSPFY